MSTKTAKAKVKAEAQERPEIPSEVQKPVGLKITPPNFLIFRTTIVGTEPLVVHRFGEKARKLIEDKQRKGRQAISQGKARDAKDFDALYLESMHAFADGSGYGIPAAAFRSALVSACRLVNFKMTMAKLALFVVADGVGADGTQLVRIIKGAPRKLLMPVRLETGGADIRVRALWEPGWECKVNIKYDADMFSASDVANLLDRAGQQIGVCEGRPDSKKSAGQGWGLFEVKRGS